MRAAMRWLAEESPEWRGTMPRYRTEPHDVQEPFRESGQGEGPELESIETTFCEAEDALFFCSGYGAREIAQKHQGDSGGKIYVNSVSRKIVRKDYHLATNAPVYYAVADSPVYTLLRKEGQVLRAYWPTLDE